MVLVTGLMLLEDHSYDPFRIMIHHSKARNDNEVDVSITSQGSADETHHFADPSSLTETAARILPFRSLSLSDNLNYGSQ